MKKKSIFSGRAIAGCVILFAVMVMAMIAAMFFREGKTESLSEGVNQEGKTESLSEGMDQEEKAELLPEGAIQEEMSYFCEIYEEYDSCDKVLMDAHFIRPYVADIFSGVALDKVNLYYEEEMSEWKESCETEVQFWRKMDQKNAESEEEGEVLLFSNYDYRHCDIVFVSDNVVSIVENYEAYSGGAAHGAHGKKCKNFNRKTGEEITLNDLAGTEEEKAVLIEAICNKLLGTPEDERMFSSDETILKEDILRAMEKSENFYYTRKGIVWVFGTYSIAPYAAGVIEAEVDFDEFR